MPINPERYCLFRPALGAAGSIDTLGEAFAGPRVERVELGLAAASAIDLG